MLELSCLDIRSRNQDLLNKDFHEDVDQDGGDEEEDEDEERRPIPLDEEEAILANKLPCVVKFLIHFFNPHSNILLFSQKFSGSGSKSQSSVWNDDDMENKEEGSEDDLEFNAGVPAFYEDMNIEGDGDSDRNTMKDNGVIFIFSCFDIKLIYFDSSPSRIKTIIGSKSLLLLLEVTLYQDQDPHTPTQSLAATLGLLQARSQRETFHQSYATLQSQLSHISEHPPFT